MPHSSGGGSSGGGFHGGSSSGGNRVSTHYFPGARRYRRYYSDGRPDEYIYATSKPTRTGISAIVILAIMGIIFMGASLFSAFTNKPRFIVPVYSDEPAIHDVVGVMEDSDKKQLLSLIKEYNKLTGICPVIYTTFDEEWNREYASLEKFAFDKYVSNFSDEQHWVFVYSIPAQDTKFNPDGLVTSSEFKWEAIQGDDTDPIITESAFNSIGRTIQRDLKDGEGPGPAFIHGFTIAYSLAKNKLHPNPVSAFFNTIGSLVPFLLVSGIFIPIFIFALKAYKKDKAMSCEEVPLDVEPSQIPGLKTYTNANGGVTTVSSGPGYYSRQTGYTAGNAPKAVRIISLIVLIPFILVGIGVLTGGLSLLKTDRTGGIFMIIFGAVWLLISLTTAFKMISAMRQGRKEADDPLTAEYPKAEYPKAEYPDVQPVVPNNVPPASEPEFDPTFFGSAKSDYESDDEDYKRMKRKGFE